jgi:hypothetical protein
MRQVSSYISSCKPVINLTNATLLRENDKTE